MQTAPPVRIEVVRHLDLNCGLRARICDFTELSGADWVGIGTPMLMTIVNIIASGKIVMKVKVSIFVAELVSMSSTLTIMSVTQVN